AALVLEQSETSSAPAPDETSDLKPAAQRLFQTLHPQERAAVLMKEVFDLSLEETAAMLSTTVGAVKSALSRARVRLDGRKPPGGFDAPPRSVVESFLRALTEKDMNALKVLCADHVSAELVGGLEMNSFDKARTFFQHAHMVMPRLGFGERPWWKVI